MSSVSVLMSTYNGEKYLVEQIESVLNQKGVDVNLFVRDDGSSDKTRSILEKYELEGKLKWYCGENLGAAYSFLDLLKKVPKDQFYAFCDQDDVWDNSKLAVAVNELGKYEEDEVVLYSCSVRPVTFDLQPIAYNKKIIPVTTFIDSLIRNNNQGCTMVFNNALMILLKRYDGKNLLMHDDLALKVCLAVGGKVVKDSNSYIAYRQHANNVIGANESFLHSLKRRIHSLFTQSCERSKELQDILELYEAIIPEENALELKKVAYYKKYRLGKIKVLFNRKIVSKDRKTTRHFRVGIILGFF